MFVLSIQWEKYQKLVNGFKPGLSAIFIGILILGSAHLPSTSSITKKPITVQPLSQKLIAKYSRYQT